jgi:hypothetical protein
MATYTIDPAHPSTVSGTDAPPVQTAIAGQPMSLAPRPRFDALDVSAIRSAGLLTPNND